MDTDKYWLKTGKKLLFLLLFALLVVVQGCGKQQPDFRPISGGYGVVTKWVGIDSGPGGGIYFKDANSKITLIWPFIGLSGAPMLFTNDMAFFIGEMPDNQGRMGDGAYFAVAAPGPAVDVSEDLLKLWAESNKIDFQKIKRFYSPLHIQEVKGEIQVEYVGGERFPDYPEAKYVATWEQLSNLIQNAKRTGKEHTLGKPQVVYLKNDYDLTNDVK